MRTVYFSLVLALTFIPTTLVLAADHASLARKATWAIEMNRGIASGFLVQAGSRYHLFTAHHVSGRKLGCGTGALQTRMGFLGTEKRKFAFVASPETCNFPYDVTSVATTPGSALGVVTKSELPLIGERVVVSGYPMQRESKLTQHACTLRGFDLMNDHGEGDTGLAAYSIACDGVDYDVGGMSGGSVVSLKTGKVIGVITGQQEREGAEGSESTYLNLLVVSPLWLDGEQVRNGYPKDEPATRCYDSGNKREPFYRCAIRGGKIQ